ncbi:glutaredoxin family protein [Billgrantia montanilacus]|uniref:Glutaredoxin family protein n=1 Tax=Billgrantia montanilacus TaxID=2282305 RepID=A0A368TYJ6_9GAMM|nr:glutaredoxin family protein [Halomonas montanilacus]RCV89814.1 glutaredoxin family protein [Halomonas montanilacus]
MIRLKLYTTLGCHLCEQQESLLALLLQGEYHLEKVEISEDDALIECYGVRIPVLADESGKELDRGFEPPRLAAWLAERHWLDEAAWQRLNAGELEPQEVREQRKQQAPRPGGRRYLL